ncbi:AraC family transcriptional regulator [Pedobacter sp. SL55]|uniref:AraC family transcriptional regulator n=1 Tax=Pedobacter sp. SL55 TaxID=2995161 RepID=UPI00226EAFE0|nr:AraC family transcriptional regulator [Pedobacter sp. SL55]WAC39771.1 AraC family transcriptional regulator [Pedobacter sp. SL55]
MKPKLLKIQSPEIESFSARRDLTPTVNSIWHYHEELELVYFAAGEGTQFIGDNISRFKSGDVVLVGSNLPHYWRFDQDYFLANGKSADIYVIHFHPHFLGQQFLEVPENRELKKLISNSSRGLQITLPNIHNVINLIEKTVETEHSRRLLYLLEALFEISSRNSELSAIASMGFKYTYLSEEQDQIQNIYNYTLNHYKRKITLAEIAEVAKVSPNTFCKFFKSRSRKNYTDFVNEIRVGQACKLLIENKFRINEVCFESGFNNFASFHKCFKKVTGKSPLQYQRNFISP